MWLIKSETQTNKEYGKTPKERNLRESIQNSIIIVDKHSGPTSHQVSQWLKEIFGVEKTGHSGTLDPAVTGVLPVAVGNAVKAMPVLSGLEKEYVGVMHLHKEISEDVLHETLKKFIGKIKQVPPKKSAVARREREREVFYFDVLEIKGKDVLFKTGTEAGTYIRKLVHDIGQSLGSGAHMAELRRTKVNGFLEKDAHSLLEIKDAYEFAKSGDESKLRKILIPIEYAIPHVKKIFVKDSAINSIANGAPVFVGGISKIQKEIVRGETVAVFSLKEELVCIGIAKMTSEEMMERKKGSAVRTDRVFIEKGIYPIALRKI